MKPLNIAIAFSQLLLLGAWEAIGVIAFGWDPLTIAAVLVVGLWTLNVAVASGVSTYIKLTTPPKPKDTAVVNNLTLVPDPVDIDPEDAA